MRKTLLIPLLTVTLTAGAQTEKYDLNGDSKVNIADVVVLINNLTGKNQTTSQGKAPSGVTAVDLGLPSGTKWANMNVGANKPEDFGLFYAWGETVGYTYNQDHSFILSNYKWYSGTKFIKYCPSDATNIWGGSGAPDNIVTLQAADDVASVSWGGSWKTPTLDQINELLENTTRTWYDDYNGTGVAGSLFTSSVNGHSIFLPAAGNRSANRYLYSPNGRYWSSTLNLSKPAQAKDLYFRKNEIAVYNNTRCDGDNVRPVMGNSQSKYDLNDDNKVNTDDVVFLVNYILSGGTIGGGGSSVNSNALVGTWTKTSNGGVKGIKFTEDGKAYYNEWSVGNQPNFDNVKSPAQVTITATTIRITHPQASGYYEEYSYQLSADGKSVTFTLVDWQKDNHGLSGTFTKV